MKKLYNVTDYGAVPNSKTLQTKELQAAIDACFLDGGGEVVVPTGRYITGTLRLRSHVTFHLTTGAILEGSTNLEDYSHFFEDTIEPIEIVSDENYLKNPLIDPWYNCIIRAYNSEDIRLIGDPGSYIDGKDVYNPNGEEGYRGPHAIHYFKCRNLEFAGYTVRNSANWSHVIFGCTNIYAHNLTVFGGHDGFHTRVGTNICIEDCEFYTGDDCIAGYDNQNVVIRNCLLDCACSAMRYGGTDILVDNCRTHAPSRYGFRGSLSDAEKMASAPTLPSHRHTQHTPFLYFCDNPTFIRKTPGNIVIQNCVFDNPNSFFRLWFDGKHRWCANRTLRDITFRNCKCVGVSMPIDMFSKDGEPTTMRLIDVEISPRAGYEDVPFMRVSNDCELIFDNVTAPGYKKPTIQASTDFRMNFRNSDEFVIEKVESIN